MNENVDTKIMIEQISEFFKGIKVLFCSEMVNLLIMDPRIQGIPLVKKIKTRVELKYYGSDYGF